MAINRKHKKEILIGFEVECILIETPRILIDTIKEKIKSLHRGMDIGGDGSIEWDDSDFNGVEDYNEETDTYKKTGYGVEVRTPPLPANEAVKLLKRLFKIVAKYGFTNDSCGLHLNFSCRNQKKRILFNPILFAAHPIWEEIGKAFNREDNDFCLNHAENYSFNKVSDLYENGESLIEDCRDKYSAVNLGYLSDDNTGRIEIRIMGGEDYHKKFKTVESFSDRILNLYHKVCIPALLPEAIKV